MGKQDKFVSRLRDISSEFQIVLDKFERLEFDDSSKNNIRELSFDTRAESLEPQILHLASEEYRVRFNRHKYIDPDLISDPAWDILIDLVVQKCRRKRTQVTSSIIASGVPATTGLRWLGLLIDRGLVVRFPSEHDKRVSYVELSPKGWRAMVEYFTAVYL